MIAACPSCDKPINLVPVAHGQLSFKTVYEGFCKNKNCLETMRVNNEV